MKAGEKVSRGKDLGMARTNPFEFLQQVRTEVAKVTWPTRRETVITTIMVLAMSVAAALFFLAADWILSSLVTLVLGLGR
jgi:preprotein translocase subunit SecE